MGDPTVQHYLMIMSISVDPDCVFVNFESHDDHIYIM